MKQPNALSEQELNFLVKVLGHASSIDQENIREARKHQQEAWIHADKETSYGRQAFADLNEVREYLRYAKKQQKMLAGILHKLKKQR
jgi:F0F1-type ATP synthase epsilon subunit